MLFHGIAALTQLGLAGFDRFFRVVDLPKRAFVVQMPEGFAACDARFQETLIEVVKILELAVESDNSKIVVKYAKAVGDVVQCQMKLGFHGAGHLFHATGQGTEQEEQAAHAHDDEAENTKPRKDEVFVQFAEYFVGVLTQDQDPILSRGDMRVSMAGIMDEARFRAIGAQDFLER